MKTINDTSTPLLYQGVMISSTYEDLKDYRDVMMQALDAYDLHPVKMENQRPHYGTNVMDNSLQKVSISHAFVAIVGQRYGNIPETPNNPRRLSLIELEYNAAQQRGIPMLVLIQKEDIAAQGANAEPDESIRKHRAFRKRVQEQLCTVFTDLTDFIGKARDAAVEIRRLLLEENSKAPASLTPDNPRRQLPIVHPDPAAAPPPKREPIPPPKHEVIPPHTHQQYVEFRFTEVLRPILRDLKNLLNVPELALAFLPRRSGTAAPTLAQGDYNKQEKIRASLLAQSIDLRPHELRIAVVIDKGGELLFHSERKNTPGKYVNALENGLRATAWSEWVETDPSEQVRRWVSTPTKEIVCSLKYIPSRDNLDVVGFVVVPRRSRSAGGGAAGPEVGEQVEQLVEKQLLPILRHLLLDFAKQKVYEHSEREVILNTILEAAVSLSGANWGCIKSSTLGATSSDLHDEECEKVQAVCVHYCPRFFQEGRLVDTEQLVAFAVEEEKDMVLDLSESTRDTFRHPAMQMAVFLIRDHEEVIEPRLLDSDVVGAIVVQHTATNYLNDFMPVYSPFLKELAEVTARATRTAASKALASILRKGITGKLAADFERKVDGVIQKLAPAAPVTWVLLQPDGRFFKKVCESPNDLAGMKQVLIELIGADEPIHKSDKLAAFVCNSTISLHLPLVHYRERRVAVERVGINEIGAYAYFQEGYDRAVADLQRDSMNQVLFNLGNQELWKDADDQTGGDKRWGAVVIVPIVSPVGSPVGVLAVLREVSNLVGPKWNPKLTGFQTELAELRDELYANHLALGMAGNGR